MAKSEANPLWPHYAAVSAIALALFAGLFRFLVLDAQDPLKCSALLNEGQWLDSKMKNWQPEGCMIHPYKEKEISTCMQGRRVIFAGDSVTRQLYFAYAHTTDSSLPHEPPEDAKKHSDYTLHSPNGDIYFEFMWDPFLNSTNVKNMLATGDTRGPTKPALLVLGSGLWYLRYSAESGGLAAWEANIDSTFKAIQGRSLADRVVVLPVEEPVISKLSPERASSIHLGDVDAMNSDLIHRIAALSPGTSLFGASSLPVDPIALPTVFNKMLNPEQTTDGLHFNNVVLSQHANLLMNLQCNQVLPKSYPFDKTCCNSYPQTPFLQLFLLVVVLLAGPFFRFVGPSLVKRKPVLAPFLPSNDYWIPMTIFGVVIGMNFMADRTTVWLKEQKQFEPWVFSGLCLMSMAAGLGSLKSKDKDLGFLNREQTDEWKGWMQIAILIYHYLGASKVAGIYNPVRVLVASYLWMTGYGHFHFYYKKADFGMLRIAQVMVRLNTLTIVLAYVMDTDYVFYYFAPLVSFWFAVIYGTMFIGSKYNENTTFIVCKLLASCAVTTYVFKSQWAIEAIFSFLNNVFAIRWQAREWMFRVTLDMWIVYIGMFVALATIKIQQYNLTDSPHWPFAKKGAIGLSVVGMLWFFWFELSQPSKFAYNKYHPYMSWVPVLSFIVLRNATVTLRSGNSRAFGWIGRCSLETFIMQYHFWLAADTRGILMVLPLGTRWRTLNMLLSTIGFLYVCHHVAEATGWLTNWVCGTPRKRTLPPPATAAQQGTGPARAEEGIPLLAQSSETSKEGNGSAAGKEVVFDADAPTPNGTPNPNVPSSSSSPHNSPSPRPTVVVPDTPMRPQARWLDRLAEAPGSPGPGWSPYLATRNRVFGAWDEAANNPAWNLGVKGAGILLVLWILNLLWAT